MHGYTVFPTSEGSREDREGEGGLGRRGKREGGNASRKRAAKVPFRKPAKKRERETQERETLERVGGGERESIFNQDGSSP